MTAAAGVDPYAEPLARAARALEADPAQALGLADTVLARNAADPRARLIVGAARRRLGDFEGARAVLEPLARTQPNSAPAQFELALTLGGARGPGRRRGGLRARRGPEARSPRGLAGPGAMQGGRRRSRRLCRRAAPRPEAQPRVLRTSPATSRFFCIGGRMTATRSTLPSDWPRPRPTTRRFSPYSPPAPPGWETTIAPSRSIAACWLDIPRRRTSGSASATPCARVGDRAGAVESYRRCLALSGGSGEAYWSLANLKSLRFSAEDEAVLGARLEEPGLAAADRLHLHYALGRLLEDDRRFEASFRHYAAGAALCREQRPYDADATTTAMSRIGQALTSERIAESAGARCAKCADLHRRPAPLRIDPRRADPRQPFRRRGVRRAADPGQHRPRPRRAGPAVIIREALRRLTRDAAAKLGERYLAETRVYRRLGRARFVDKMPNNFHHLGLIRLAIPGARIIDARRAADGQRVFPVQAAFRRRTRLLLRPARHRRLRLRL